MSKKTRQVGISLGRMSGVSCRECGFDSRDARRRTMLEKERWSVGVGVLNQNWRQWCVEGLIGVREFFGALMRRLMR